MSQENAPNRYEDIIGLPHHVSAKHPHLSIHDRAAQFAPFAALVGYEDNIDEAGRLTAKKIELSENSKQELDEKLRFIIENPCNNINVQITYFVPDNIKDGGTYITKSGALKKVDMYNKTIIMQDLSIIPIEAVTDIVSEVFNKLDYI